MTHRHVDRIFVLTTDASTVGIGAELAQETPVWLRPVSYFSRTLSKSEKRYSTYDQEFLAIVMAIRHFRHHLLGTTFRLRTDHRPLQFMSTTKDPWEQRARWIVELKEYSFTVEYIESQRNVVEDALSRLGYDQASRMGESDVARRSTG